MPSKPAPRSGRSPLTIQPSQSATASARAWARSSASASPAVPVTGQSQRRAKPRTRRGRRSSSSSSAPARYAASAAVSSCSARGFGTAPKRDPDCKRRGCAFMPVRKSRDRLRASGAAAPRLRSHGTARNASVRPLAALAQGGNRVQTQPASEPRADAAAGSGVTLAVYAPFGTDAELSTYPDGTSVDDRRASPAEAPAPGGRAGRGRLALIDLLDDDTWLVEIPAGSAGRAADHLALEAADGRHRAPWPACCATPTASTRAPRSCWRWRAMAPATCPTSTAASSRRRNLTQNGRWPAHRAGSQHHRAPRARRCCRWVAAAADGTPLLPERSPAAAGEPHAAVHLRPRRRR